MYKYVEVDEKHKKTSKNVNYNTYRECVSRCNLLKKRGPEKYNYKLYENCNGNNVYLGFHRLAINDITDNGNQPFTNMGISMICNGEIYNADELQAKFNLNLKSRSDCEVILHLYILFGFKKMLSLIDGVFSIVLYDSTSNIMWASRDAFGVRPLFVAYSPDQLYLSSEAKSFYEIEDISVFPNGSYWSSEDPKLFNPYMKTMDSHKYTLYPNRYLADIPMDCSYYSSLIHKYDNDKLPQLKEKIRNTLIGVVSKQLHSDRYIGCLLSGGLDSSLITSLIYNLTKSDNLNSTIKTYSIGLEGSTDLKYARKVSQFLMTEHHEILLSEHNIIDAIPDVIYALESWDVTTIRASLPMYLLSKYIQSETPTVKVIYSGEGADEVCQGYLYFHKTPTPLEGHYESVRLLSDLKYFDNLRADRCISSHGLELRVPFLDVDFVHTYLSVKPELRSPLNQKCEKWLLRESFADPFYSDMYKLQCSAILPDEILWRRKDGFSDGCSSLERPLYKVLEEEAEDYITDEMMENAKLNYPYNTPLTKEGLMYRQIFHKLFPEHGREKLIPYRWMPKWVNPSITNPSGRVLDVFKQNI